MNKVIQVVPTQKSLMVNRWADALRPLLNPKHKTLDALLIALVGDFEGGHMLRHLLYLFPRSSRADGAVYVTADQWQTECGLTAHQVKRAKLKLKTLLNVTVGNHDYGRATFYTLRPIALINALARLLGTSVLAVWRILRASFSTDPSGDSRQRGQSQTARPFNRTYTERETKDDVDDIKKEAQENRRDGFADTPQPHTIAYLELKNVGFSEPNLTRCATYPLSRIRELIEASRTLATSNRAGWIAEALLNNWQIPPQFRATPPVSEQSYSPKKQTDVTTALDHTEIVTEPEITTVWESESAPIIFDHLKLTGVDVWTCVLQTLRAQDRVTYDTYVKYTQYHAYTNGNLTIACKTPYIAQTLQNRLYRNIHSVLARMTTQAITITFVSKVHHA